MSTLKVDTISEKTASSGITFSQDITATLSSSSNIKAPLNATGSAPVYACRAWVNFNGAFSDSSGQSGTYACSGSTITITDTAHGLQVGDSIHAVFTRSAGDSVTITDDFFTVLTVPSADTFTIQTVVGTTDQSGTVSYDSDAATATAGSGPIHASGNVSSITDNGIGDYTVNFTTAMPDAYYSASGSATATPSSNGYRLILAGAGYYGDVLQTTSAMRFQVVHTDFAKYDADYVRLSFFR